MQNTKKLNRIKENYLTYSEARCYLSMDTRYYEKITQALASA